MKNKLLLSLILLQSYNLFGQEIPKVGFLVYDLQKHSDPVLNNTAFRNAIYTNVSNSVTNLHRFDIIPTDEMSAVDKQIETEKGIEHINAQLAERGKRMGAQMLMYAMLGAMVYEKEESKDEKTGKITSISYSGKVSYTVRCVDMTTGSIKFSKVFNGKTPSLFYKPHKILTANTNTPQGAIMTAIEDSKDDVDNWIRAISPVELRIIKFSEKNGKYELLIKGGMSTGLSKDLKKLYVKTKEAIEGETLYTTLFSIKIEEVQENLTRCSIDSKEAKKLESLWNDEKQKTGLCVMENK